VFEGADAVVHLASAYGRSEFVDASRHDTRAAKLTFDAAARAGVGQLVVLSSAMVYGARPENPIPLTERAESKPSGLSFAENKATIERLANEWQSDTGRKLTVLRPTTAVASGGSSWCTSMTWLLQLTCSCANRPMEFSTSHPTAGFEPRKSAPCQAEPLACPSRSQSQMRSCGSAGKRASSPFRPASCRTPPNRGWFPTIGSANSAGNRRGPMSRPMSRASIHGRGRT